VNVHLRRNAIVAVNEPNNLNFRWARSDHCSMIRSLTLIPILASEAAAVERRTATRSERRDPAHAQRGRTATTPRSSTSRREFQCLQPCPSTGRPAGACTGYVVDHIIPLKRGGIDAPSNMQWQTIAEAKAKDRVE
jgi:hypothetical protein